MRLPYNIESVLEKFLNEQRGDLQSLLTKEFPDLPEGTVRRVLDAFVTDEGTKRPVAYTRDESSRQIGLEESMMQLIGNLPAGALTACLEALENRRLLRFTDDTIELAHDSLAALIDDQRTDDQRQLNEVKTRIANSYRERQRTGEFLSRKQLISLENFLPKIQLEEHLAKFVADSEAEANRIESEKEAQRQAELEKERGLRAEAERAREESEQAWRQADQNAEIARKKARGARRAFIIALLFAVVSIVSMFFFIQINAREKATRIEAEATRRGAEDLKELNARIVQEKKRAEAEIVNRLLRETQVFEEAEQYYFAKQRLDTAMVRDTGNQRIKWRLEIVNRKLEKFLWEK